jgi:molecular chaperone DnaK
MKELNDAFHAASQDMYNAANAAQGGAQADPNGGAGGCGAQGAASSQNAGDNVQDADFEEVK